LYSIEKFLYENKGEEIIDDKQLTVMLLSSRNGKLSIITPIYIYIGLIMVLKLVAE
jgi:hypothetical protein